MKQRLDEQNHHVHISAKHNLFDLKLREVWKYRDLVWLFTKRSFTVTYKQTILGPLWLILNPLITSIIYTVVFGRIAGFQTDGVPKILFYLTGNAVWSFFAACVTNNARTFVNNASLFGKVYFPRLAVPLSHILSDAIQFTIQMLLISGFLLYYTVSGQVHPKPLLWLTVLPSLMQLGLMGMGIGILISSLTTKYRDLAILVDFGMRLWMYATPVVYPLSQVNSPLLARLILLNPVTMPIEQLRCALLGVGTVYPLYAVYSWVLTGLVVVLGILVFNRVERTFMDTV